MGNIYREVVCKRKTKAIILVVLFTSCMIALSTIISEVKGIDRNVRAFIDFGCVIATIFYMSYEILKCTIKYKYSIMINKLMIHRIYSNSQRNVENIDFKDIVYVGKHSDSKFDGKVHKKRYMCDLLTDEKYCCIYKTQKGFNEIYFQPSNELISRIEQIKQREQRAV